MIRKVEYDVCFTELYKGVVSLFGIGSQKYKLGIERVKRDVHASIIHGHEQIFDRFGAHAKSIGYLLNSVNTELNMICSVLVYPRILLTHHRINGIEERG